MLPIRNIFDHIKQQVKDQTNRPGARVANLHGVIEATTVVDAPPEPQTWYGLAAPAAGLPTLHDFADAYSLEKAPPVTVAATNGVASYAEADTSGSTGTSAPKRARALFGTLTPSGPLVVPVRVTSAGQRLALYVGGALVASGTGVLTTTLRLPGGAQDIAVLAFGAASAVVVTLPTAVAVTQSEPTPPPPHWELAPTVTYLKAGNGSFRVDLAWHNDAFASAWAVYRSPVSAQGTITAAALAGSLALTVSGAIYDGFAGRRIFAGGAPLGTILAVTPNKDGNGDVVDYAVEVAPDAGVTATGLVGAGAAVSDERYQALGRVGYGGEAVLRYTDTAVTQGALYVYRVTAFGFIAGTAESDYSLPEAVRVVDTVAPASIACDVAQIAVHDGVATVVFTAPADDDYRGTAVYYQSGNAWIPLTTEHGISGQPDQLSFRPSGAGVYEFRTFDWSGNEQAAGSGVQWTWTGTSLSNATPAVVLTAVIVTNTDPAYPAATYTQVQVAVVPSDATVTVDAAFHATVTPLGGGSYLVARPAFNSGTGEVRFKGAKAGYTDDTDTVTIPEVGRDTQPMTVKLTVVDSQADHVVVRVMAASRYGGTYASVAASGGTITNTNFPAGANRVAVNGGGNLAYAQGDYVCDYRVERAVFGGPVTRATFVVTPDDPNTSADTDAIDVPAQDYAPGAATPACVLLSELVTPTAVGYTDRTKYVQVNVTTTPSDATVSVESSFNATLLDSGIAGSAHYFIYQRPAYGTGMGRVTFKAAKAGYTDDHDEAYLPEVGRDTLPLSVKLRLIDIQADHVRVRVMAAARGMAGGAVGATVTPSGATITQANAPAGANRVQLNDVLDYEGGGYVIDYDVARPTFGNGVVRATFLVTPDDPNVSLDSDSVDVPAQDYLPGAPKEAVANIVANSYGGYSGPYTDPKQYVHVIVDAHPSTYYVSLLDTLNVGLMNASTDTYGNYFLGSHRYIFVRPVFGGGLGKVQFALSATSGGAVVDTDMVSIAEQGRDTIPLRTRVRLVSVNATTVDLEITASSKYYDTDAGVAVTVAGTGIPQPGWSSLAGTLDGSGNPLLRTSTQPGYATGTGGSNSYSYATQIRVARPPFGAGAGRVTITVTSTDANVAADADAFDIPAQDYVAPQVPTLSVRARPDLTTATTQSFEATGGVTPSTAGLQLQATAVLPSPSTPADTAFATVTNGSSTGAVTQVVAATKLAGVGYVFFRVVSADGHVSPVERVTVDGMGPTTALSSDVRVIYYGTSCTDMGTAQYQVTLDRALPANWTFKLYDTANALIYTATGAAGPTFTAFGALGGWGQLAPAGAQRAVVTTEVDYRWEVYDAGNALVYSGNDLRNIPGLAHACP